MTSRRGPWPWSRPVREPDGDDITVTVTIQWGLAKLSVTTAPTAPRLWLHGVAISATATSRAGGDDAEDSYLCAIGEPIRMSPSGRFDDAWRPQRFGLDDPTMHRPIFLALASVSTRRHHPTKLRPRVDVVDDFAWVDGRYELIEGSPLWRANHEAPKRYR